MGPDERTAQHLVRAGETGDSDRIGRFPAQPKLKISTQLTGHFYLAYNRYALKSDNPIPIGNIHVHSLELAGQ